MRIIIALLLLAASLPGCGKKGPLIPPEALVPAAVRELQVRQQGNEFRISWIAPSREQGGRPLKDLAGFRLLRRDLAGDGSDCAACADAWRLLSAIDLDYPGETRQLGGSFLHFDRGLTVGSGYQYRLLAFSRSGGISQPATSAVRTLQPTVAPPAITAQILPAAVRLAFDYTPPAGAKLLGFNVYRRQAGGERPLLPLNGTPIGGSSWDDQQLDFGKRYRYQATALVEVGGETVESLPSPELEVLFTLQELR